MDTIGDAYIVAGFVGPADSAGNADLSRTSCGAGSTSSGAGRASLSNGNERRPSACCAAYGAGRGPLVGRAKAMQAVCWDVLFVARAMIKTIAKYRAEQQRDAHCRC